jgi:cytochrome c
MMACSPLGLRQLGPEQRVVSITHCRDTYNVTTGDGQTLDFWERNLRFKTDTSESGPLPRAPAIVSSDIAREHAVLIFSAPEEISASIQPSC